LRDLPDFDIRSAPFKLSDAQLVIAREHAFESWPTFARHVRTLHLAEAAASPQEVPRPHQFAERIPVDGIELAAEITVPNNATRLVMFTFASGSSRYNPKHRYVADVLHRGGIGTVLMDLLTEEEELVDMETEELRFDLRLLNRRIAAITDWLGQQPILRDLGLGFLGSGTGAAAALFAAAERPSVVQAVVSSGGRPDLAGPWLWKVHAATFFVVGGKDTATVAFNHAAMAWLPRQTLRKLEIIDGARHLFDEKNASEINASLIHDWFRRHLVNPERGPLYGQ